MSSARPRSIPSMLGGALVALAAAGCEGGRAEALEPLAGRCTLESAYGWPQTLYALGEDAVWAGGPEGALLHFDGTSWRNVPLPLREGVVRIAGTAVDRLAAVTDGGTLLRGHGSNWAVRFSEPTYAFAGLAMAADGRLWASANRAGTDGGACFVLEFSPGEDTPVEHTFATPCALGAVAVGSGGAGDAVYVADQSARGPAAVHRFQSGTWDLLTLGAPDDETDVIFDLWVSPAGTLLAAGAVVGADVFGRLWRWDGGTATVHAFDDTRNLIRVGGFPDQRGGEDAWIVGRNGELYTGLRNDWRVLPSDERPAVSDGLLTGRDTGFLADGTLRRLADGRWVALPQDHPADAVHAVLALGPDEAYAAGQGGLFHGKAGRWHALEDLPCTGALARVGDDLCCVSGGGFEVSRCDLDGHCDTATADIEGTLSDVAVAPDGACWFTAWDRNFQSLYRFSNGTLTPISLAGLAEPLLHGLWLGADGAGFAVGERGLILSLTTGAPVGAPWRRETSPTPYAVDFVAGRTGGPFYALGGPSRAGETPRLDLLRRARDGEWRVVHREVGAKGQGLWVAENGRAFFGRRGADGRVSLRAFDGETAETVADDLGFDVADLAGTGETALHVVGSAGAAGRLVCH